MTVVTVSLLEGNGGFILGARSRGFLRLLLRWNHVLETLGKADDEFLGFEAGKDGNAEH